ncbi:TetR/AcrR family transcriptional regulator [Polynucleobacter corsicus]|uniref:TetR/AcrR family transcriptional regulator n=1 Tax=Polynucleobacter corsicus TaxID=2081042 RepID=UPI001BFD7C55|nr:TetR/AcrR family transcriptional regulator [Polynucleobacter corsicus]QWE19201.1 TetR/AcrR family transcriptional regulator [Polynucleobacter corsicus]
MKYDPSSYSKKSQQQRSLKTIEDILDAAGKLSNHDSLEEPSVRALSSKSGYALGTIYRYFASFDDIYLQLFLWRRKKTIGSLIKLVQSHEPHRSLTELITNIVQVGIQECSSKPKAILKMAIRQFFKHSKEPEKFNTLMDELIAPFLEAQKRDQTNTFRVTSEDDMRFQVRALQMAIRNPFFEGDPIAGADEHRRLAIEMGVRLLGKPGI